MRFGYCAVTADILHSGHIKYIQKCSENCDMLYVGVMTDNAVLAYKHRKPVIPYEERAFVVSNIKGVYRVIPQDTFEFPKLDHINVWFDSTEHRRHPATIFYAREKGISSSDIKRRIRESPDNSECKV